VVAEWKDDGRFSGRELYEWICRRQPDLENRLIFTMAGTTSVDESLPEIPATGQFLRKPFRVEEFLNVVRHALRSKETSKIKR